MALPKRNKLDPSSPDNNGDNINQSRMPSATAKNNTVNTEPAPTPNEITSFALPDIEDDFAEDIVSENFDYTENDIEEDLNVEDDVFSWEILDDSDSDDSESFENEAINTSMETLEDTDNDLLSELVEVSKKSTPDIPEEQDLQDIDTDSLLAMLEDDATNDNSEISFSVDEGNEPELDIENFDMDELTSMLDSEETTMDELTFDDDTTGLENLGMDELAAMLNSDTKENSNDNSDIKNFDMDTLESLLGEEEPEDNSGDFDDDFGFETIAEASNSDDDDDPFQDIPTSVNEETVTKNDFTLGDNDEFSFNEDSESDFMFEDTNNENSAKDDWEKDFESLSNEGDDSEDGDEDEEDELDAIFDTVSKKKRKKPKGKGRKGSGLKNNIIFKGYMWVAGLLYDLLTKLITILGKIPVIGKIFRPLNKLIKVGGKKYFPLVFLLLLVFIPFMLSVPSGVTMSLPDEGGLKTFDFKYSNNTASGKIENTGNIVITGEPIYNIYGFKPTFNPKTWVTFSYLGSCQGDPIEVDISEIEEISMKCVPESNGLFKKTAIGFELDF